MKIDATPPPGPALTAKYDAAAPAWGDKMRTLGYFDGYLGFLADENFRAPGGLRVMDIGCGTAAFAEAWIAIQGPDQAITLLEPSGAMLARGAARLEARGVVPDRQECLLDGYDGAGGFDVLLAAHVIEHGTDPVAMLRDMRALVRPGARLWLVVSKPHWCNAIIWFQWRHRSYRPAEVAVMLEHSGWSLRSDYPFPSGPPSRTSRGYACLAV